MSLRNAIRQNAALTAVLFLFGGWTLFTLWSVYGSMGPVTGGDWIGPNGVGGVAGVVILAVVLALVVTVYAELGETGPAPERFPPDE
ncbi:hypothetical protein [Halegenticoccus tardaugens]|uniref:hypothetical protein n=1 Tax=Halegenticoccus tardaugens TaxID=2071624 RepID=UPI00100AF55A|nr:hypothetical protein [Halegenticoccus tardaugens]